MSNLLSQDIAALKFLMSDDLYQIAEPSTETAAVQIIPKPEKLSEKPVPDTEKGTITDFNYIGENNKYFLILIEDQIHTTISAAHKEMLLKMMQAKKMDLRDLAILNIQKYPDAKFEELKSFFVCSKLLMFGISSTKLGMNSVPLNRPEKYKNVNILSSYSLNEMQNDVTKKREFWNVMKDF